MGLFGAVMWIAGKLRDKADAELHDDAPVRKAMVDLYRQLEAGTIGEAEFELREAELVERLEEIRVARGDGPDADDEEGDEEPAEE